MANEKPAVHRECDACDKVRLLAQIRNMWLCPDCYAQELVTNPLTTKENAISAWQDRQIEVTPITTPIDEILKKAFIDKTNDILVSGMTPEQVKYHIADLQNMVKVLNVQIQATMDIDEQWDAKATVEERARLREKDKEYRSKARPVMNADGTRKVKVAVAPKPQVIGDAGDKAFENLVTKLTNTGMSRDKAVELIRGMKGNK